MDILRVCLYKGLPSSHAGGRAAGDRGALLCTKLTLRSTLTTGEFTIMFASNLHSKYSRLRLAMPYYLLPHSFCLRRAQCSCHESLMTLQMVYCENVCMENSRLLKVLRTLERLCFVPGWLSFNPFPSSKKELEKRGDHPLPQEKKKTSKTPSQRLMMRRKTSTIPDEGVGFSGIPSHVCLVVKAKKSNK